MEMVYIDAAETMHDEPLVDRDRLTATESSHSLSVVRHSHNCTSVLLEYLLQSSQLHVGFGLSLVLHNKEITASLDHCVSLVTTAAVYLSQEAAKCPRRPTLRGRGRLVLNYLLFRHMFSLQQDTQTLTESCNLLSPLAQH